MGPADPAQLAAQLSTQNWVLDVFLFLLASVILTAVAAWYNASKDAAAAGASGWLRRIMVRLGLAQKLYTLTVEYNTIVNKWGDESAFNCSDDNKYMIKALFSYADHLRCLRAARVRVEPGDYFSSKYKRMKAMEFRLRELNSSIVIDRDLSMRVEQSTDKGTEKTGRTSRSMVVIESRSSFRACRDFAKKAFDFFVEEVYKKYDDEDEDKKLKYFSVRNIEHDSGDVTWNQYFLNTERGFDYLYFDDKEATVSLIDNFVNRTAQFAIGGPAYKLGFLLYGVPGCGKTSFIKALANHTKRHIVDIHLSKFEKNSELRDAFFQTNLKCYDTQNCTVDYDIPLDRRIIIMEDVDALSDIVTRRSEKDTWHNKDFKKLTEKGSSKRSSRDGDDERESGDEEEEGEKREPTEAERLTEMVSGKSSSGDGDVKLIGGDDDEDKEKGADSAIEKYLKKTERMEDRLNLAAMLSILDGTLELTGPILIMTTNHPEKLDPALIRSGRITKHIWFGRMNLQSLVSMLEFYFNDKVVTPDAEIEELHSSNLRNSLRGSGACMDDVNVFAPPSDDQPDISPAFRARYQRVFQLIPNFERLHRKVAPNDLEAICRNSDSLETCCRTLAEMVNK